MQNDFRSKTEEDMTQFLCGLLGVKYFRIRNEDNMYFDIDDAGHESLEKMKQCAIKDSEKFVDAFLQFI